ncbi:DUF72 domain-containing protein [Sphingosinicellaceae bacterium]|nr:DUF72 domain-containing protein [Sphingosinicellaceae bacterium]
MGTAGWSIPQTHDTGFPSKREGASHLERYAARFDAVEINSSFHRPHRRATYARWAASVGPGFRFAVKLPRTISHDRRLVDCGDLIERFAAEVDGLGDRRGPLLLQLPPSLAFDPGVVAAFLRQLAAGPSGSIACEPRHASWFTPAADALLTAAGVARVAADPARAAGAETPGGWPGLAYFRWHGSPHVYRSAYPAAVLAAHGARLAALAAAGVPSWTIFDNTASGAATGNALELAGVRPSAG